MRKAFPARSFRGRVTLLELVFVTLFFALSSVLILRLFIVSDAMRNASGASTQAAIAAQDWADRLYASPEDMRVVLQDGGWQYDLDGGLTLKEAEYTLFATDFISESIATGALTGCRITAYHGQDMLFTLPVSRFRQGEAP